VLNDLLPTCPITKVEILGAEYSFVPNFGSLKGKTAPMILSRVILNTFDNLPDRILEEP